MKIEIKARRTGLAEYQRQFLAGASGKELRIAFPTRPTGSKSDWAGTRHANDWTERAYLSSPINK